MNKPTDRLIWSTLVFYLCTHTKTDTHIHTMYSIGHPTPKNVGQFTVESLKRGKTKESHPPSKAADKPRAARSSGALCRSSLGEPMLQRAGAAFGVPRLDHLHPAGSPSLALGFFALLRQPKVSMRKCPSPCWESLPVRIAKAEQRSKRKRPTSHARGAFSFISSPLK